MEAGKQAHKVIFDQDENIKRNNQKHIEYKQDLEQELQHGISRDQEQAF